MSTSSIFNADYGEASTPTSSSTFHLSRPPLTPNTFTPRNTTPLIPETPMDEHDPDYENIENFATQEEAPAVPPLPPLLPPRPAKQRTTSVVEDRPLPEISPIKRMNSMPLVNFNFEDLKDSPELHQKPIRMPIRPPPPPPPEGPEVEAPPLPPRHPLRSPSSSSNGPPPLPPRSSQIIDPPVVIDDELKPPALPPKSKK